MFGSITHRGGRDARVPVRCRFANYSPSSPSPPANKNYAMEIGELGSTLCRMFRLGGF
ncbi:MAG: hypothetical protein LBQ66_01550 [Planctomycetaceae bacterium]|nr:hypothetical protein [Planctomycetaceae bacterium]